MTDRSDWLSSDDWMSDALMRGVGGLEETEGGLDGNLGMWAAGRAAREAATRPDYSAYPVQPGTDYGPLRPGQRSIPAPLLALVVLLALIVLLAVIKLTS